MAERAPDGRKRRPAHEPTRVLKVPGGGFSALALALTGAMGVLAGVLVAVLLASSGPAEPETTTVVQRPPAATVTVPAETVTGGTVIQTTAVPPVVGERLDVARERVERAGFEVDVEGGGTFGVVVDSNWVVVSQTPAGEQTRELGSRVTLTIERA